MCRWIYKIRFKCDCRVNNKGHVLFPKACRKARKKFRGDDYKPGVKQVLFCQLPHGRGPEVIKMRIHYMCSYHYNGLLGAREAEKRAARKPKDYKSVTDVAKSGLFDSVFEKNERKIILIHALGWERGDLIVRPEEKFEMSGGSEPAKEVEKEPGKPEEAKANGGMQPSAKPLKEHPTSPKTRTGKFGGLFDRGKQRETHGPSKKAGDVPGPSSENVYPAKPSNAAKPLNEREKRAAAAEARRQPIAESSKSAKGKGKASPNSEDESGPLAFETGSNAGSNDSDGTRSYVSDGSSVGEGPQWRFHS